MLCLELKLGCFTNSYYIVDLYAVEINKYICDLNKRIWNY